MKINPKTTAQNLSAGKNLQTSTNNAPTKKEAAELKKHIGKEFAKLDALAHKMRPIGKQYYWQRVDWVNLSAKSSTVRFLAELSIFPVAIPVRAILNVLITLGNTRVAFIDYAMGGLQNRDRAHDEALFLEMKEHIAQLRELLPYADQPNKRNLELLEDICNNKAAREALVSPKDFKSFSTDFCNEITQAIQNNYDGYITTVSNDLTRHLGNGVGQQSIDQLLGIKLNTDNTIDIQSVNFAHIEAILDAVRLGRKTMNDIKNLSEINIDINNHGSESEKISTDLSKFKLTNLVGSRNYILRKIGISKDFFTPQELQDLSRLLLLAKDGSWTSWKSTNRKKFLNVAQKAAARHNLRCMAANPDCKTHFLEMQKGFTKPELENTSLFNKALERMGIDKKHMPTEIQTLLDNPKGKQKALNKALADYADKGLALYGLFHNSNKVPVLLTKRSTKKDAQRETIKVLGNVTEHWFSSSVRFLNPVTMEFQSVRSSSYDEINLLLGASFAFSYGFQAVHKRLIEDREAKEAKEAKDAKLERSSEVALIRMESRMLKERDAKNASTLRESEAKNASILRERDAKIANLEAQIRENDLEVRVDIQPRDINEEDVPDNIQKRMGLLFMRALDAAKGTEGSDSKVAAFTVVLGEIEDAEDGYKVALYNLIFNTALADNPQTLIDFVKSYNVDNDAEFLRSLNVYLKEYITATQTDKGTENYQRNICLLQALVQAHINGEDEDIENAAKAQIRENDLEVRVDIQQGDITEEGVPDNIQEQMGLLFMRALHAAKGTKGSDSKVDVFTGVLGEIKGPRDGYKLALHNLIFNTPLANSRETLINFVKSYNVDNDAEFLKSLNVYLKEYITAEQADKGTENYQRNICLLQALVQAHINGEDIEDAANDLEAQIRENDLEVRVNIQPRDINEEDVPDNIQKRMGLLFMRALDAAKGTEGSDNKVAAFTGVLGEIEDAEDGYKVALYDLIFNTPLANSRQTLIDFVKSYDVDNVNNDAESLRSLNVYLKEYITATQADTGRAIYQRNICLLQTLVEARINK